MSRRRGIAKGKSNRQNIARYCFSQTLKGLSKSDFGKVKRAEELASGYIDVKRCSHCEMNDFGKCKAKESDKEMFCSGDFLIAMLEVGFPTERSKKYMMEKFWRYWL